MPRLVLFFAATAALAACNEKNPQSCDLPGNDSSDECNGSGSGTDSGSGGSCKTSTDCMTIGLFVCDTAKAGGTCVQCTHDNPDACTKMNLACDAISDTCAPCKTDDDCTPPSGAGVCMPSGSCAAGPTIVYVAATGGSSMSATCGASTAPCDLTTALLVTSMHADRNVLKLGPGTYTSAANNFPINIDTTTNLTIDARGATIHGNGNGAIFTINSGKSMTLLGGTVELARSNGGSGAAGDGDGVACNSTATFSAYETVFQNNDASGVDANGCNLKLTSVSIHDNSKASVFPGIAVSGGLVEISRSKIASNKGGGLNLNGAPFTVVDNVFWNNGDPNGNAGGVLLNSSGASSRFDFNTVVNNKTKASAPAGGVIALTGGDFKASNNIIYENNDPQVSGGPFTYCDIGPTAVAAGSDGGNNISSAPMFKDPGNDFQPTQGSPVKGKADPNADLTGIAAKDINGVARMAPADIGAYVVPVP